MFAKYNHFMKRILTIILGLFITIIPLKLCVGETFDTTPSILLITEIMPNPKGADKGQEWIEIYNTTPQRISLSNWKLNNGKIFKIPEGLSVLPNTYFVLQSENLKMTLKNTNASISLIDPSDNIVQELSYQKSKEAESYSLLNIKTLSSTKNLWDWGEPTKGTKNTTLYLLKGKITKPPSIEKDFYFEISVSNKNLKIIFLEEKYNFDLLQTLLLENAEGNFLLEKSTDKLILKDFKITTPPPPETLNSENPQNQTQQKYYWLLIPIILLTIGLIYLTSRKTRTVSLPS